MIINVDERQETVARDVRRTVNTSINIDIYLRIQSQEMFVLRIMIKTCLQLEGMMWLDGRAIEVNFERMPQH